MFNVYPAIFIKEENQYTVLFPDFGGATCGETLEDAYYMANDYLGINLMDYFQENLKEVNVKSIRKNVTIPSWLNEVAKRNNINFSKILQEALEKELEIE